MEGAKARVVAVMLIMMLVLQVGKPAAAIEIPPAYAACVAGCLAACALALPICIPACAAACAELRATTSTSPVDSNRHYCHVGCATLTCSKITSPHNLRPTTKEVEGCVNSCSERCNKQY